MITRNRAISILFALAVLAGCASTKVTQQTTRASPEFSRPPRSNLGLRLHRRPGQAPRRFL